jgi:uncharacterized membrane protein YdjX (TVP38/TMEM64 family)
MDSRRPAIARIAVYGAVSLVVVGTLAVTGNIPSSSEARDFGDDLGPLAAILFVPLFVLANFAITWPILAGAAGLLFGTVAGTPLAGEHRGRLLPQRTRRIENFLTANGAVAVMESRIVPLLPYGLVNYSGGLTHLAYRAMAIGTLIGAAPKVFAYTALGGSLDDLTSPEALAALVVLVLLALGGALFVWRQAGGNPWRRGGPGTRPPASARPRG